MEDTDRELLIRIDERVEHMNRELFGNGQPGKIDELDERIADVEGFRGKILAIVAAATFFCVLVTAWAAWARS